MNAAGRTALMPGGNGQTYITVRVLIRGRNGRIQHPQRCAKLSEVVISNKMQDLSGLSGPKSGLAVPPYLGLRSPNVSGARLTYLGTMRMSALLIRDLSASMKISRRRKS